MDIEPSKAGPRRHRILFRTLLAVVVAMIVAIGVAPGAAQAEDPAADPAGSVPAPAAQFTDDGRRYLPEDFTRSLAYSGALALSLASIGLAMVGWRRRQW